MRVRVSVRQVMEDGCGASLNIIKNEIKYQTEKQQQEDWRCYKHFGSREQKESQRYYK